MTGASPLLAADAASPVPAGEWRIDAVHSSVEFAVQSMGLITLKGLFTDVQGALTSDGRGGLHVAATVPVASIDTRNARRDQNLRSTAFLDADAHPHLTWQSHELPSPDADGARRVYGELAFRGVRRTVALTAHFSGPVRDPWGGQRVAVRACGEIDRRDFGLTASERIPTGEALIGDHVGLELNIAAVLAAGTDGSGQP